MVAVAYNDRRIADLLIKHGANVNYVSGNTMYDSALAVAVAYGRLSPSIDHPDFAMLHYLLDNGADPNAVTDDGRDVAIFSSMISQYRVVNILLDHGYHRDLPELRRMMTIGYVLPDLQVEREQVLAKIDARLRKH